MLKGFADISLKVCYDFMITLYLDMSMKKLVIYTDASFDNKRNIGGCGIVICRGEKRRTISNWGNFYSINEAELFAIYQGSVLSGGEPATIITDSQTALEYIKNNIKDKPRTREQFLRHKRCQFWAYKIRKFKNCTFEKVKAHQKYHQRKNIANNMADLMAKDGLAKFYLTLSNKRVR